jgi:hypothetical protein
MARRPELEVFARRARPQVHHRRPARGLPPQEGAAGPPRSPRPLSRPASGSSDIVAFESLVDGREHVALTKGEIEGRRRRPRPDALRVPHRGRVRLRAVRLRRPAPRGHGPRWRKRAGRDRLSPPGGAGDRPRQQDPGVPPPGRRSGHGRGQREPRLQAPDLRDYGIGAQILLAWGSGRSASSPTTPRRSWAWTDTTSG